MSLAGASPASTYSFFSFLFLPKKPIVAAAAVVCVRPRFGLIGLAA